MKIITKGATVTVELTRDEIVQLISAVCTGSATAEAIALVNQLGIACGR